MAGAWSSITPDNERLFLDVPSAAAPGGASSSVSPAPFGEPVLLDGSTLDESVWTTISRDLVTIAKNLRTVLIPINWEFKQQDAALRNWDLWGPLIFILALSITLSLGEQNPSQVFSLVFTECGLGAVVLTINVILLGGDIVFFQSLCLLGYCLFPIEVAAIVCVLVKIKWLRTLVLVLTLAWSSLATLPFIGSTVPQTRRALAVYPVLLMYVSVGWLALVKS